MSRFSVFFPFEEFSEERRVKKNAKEQKIRTLSTCKLILQIKYMIAVLNSVWHTQSTQGYGHSKVSNKHKKDGED